MKAIFFKLNPLCHVTATLGTQRVLKLLESLSPLSELSVLQLSRKLVTLFALTTGQRAQTLHLFDIRNIESCQTHLSYDVASRSKITPCNKIIIEITC